jgi:hypothetical protein
MKNTVLSVLIILLFSGMLEARPITASRKKPVGRWKFEAPYAPEAYNTGTFDVGYVKRKYSATLMFKSGETRLTGENVKFKNDSLTFNVNVQGEYVSFIIKYESETKMTGKAAASSQEIPFILTKEKKK